MQGSVCRCKSVCKCKSTCHCFKSSCECKSACYCYPINYFSSPAVTATRSTSTTSRGPGVTAASPTPTVPRAATSAPGSICCYHASTSCFKLTSFGSLYLQWLLYLLWLLQRQHRVQVRNYQLSLRRLQFWRHQHLNQLKHLSRHQEERNSVFLSRQMRIPYYWIVLEKSMGMIQLLAINFWTFWKAAWYIWRYLVCFRAQTHPVVKEGTRRNGSNWRISWRISIW